MKVPLVLHGLRDRRQGVNGSDPEVASVHHGVGREDKIELVPPTLVNEMAVQTEQLVDSESVGYVEHPTT